MIARTQILKNQKNWFWQSLLILELSGPLKKVIELEHEKEEGTCVECSRIIANPICIGCLRQQVEDWLIDTKPILIPKLNEKTDRMSEHESVPVNHDVSCVKCGSNITVCYDCYIDEISNMMKKRDSKLVGKFNRIFNFNIGLSY